MATYKGHMDQESKVLQSTKEQKNETPCLNTAPLQDKDNVKINDILAMVISTDYIKSFSDQTEKNQSDLHEEINASLYSTIMTQMSYWYTQYPAGALQQ